MEVVGIIGDRGAGKTCLMTALLYIDYRLGFPIVANYSLNFKANYMGFAKVATLPESLRGTTIGIDELGIGADSREFFKKRNSDIAKLITQLRKRQCLFYYTVQRLNLIDKRIRQQTDKYILMEATNTEGIFIMRMLNGWNSDLLYKSKFNGKPFFDMYDTNEIIELEDKEEEF